MEKLYLIFFVVLLLLLCIKKSNINMIGSSNSGEILCSQTRVLTHEFTFLDMNLV